MCHIRMPAVLLAVQGVQWVTQPHPAWTPGDKQPNPWGSTNWQRLVPDELGAAVTYPLLISSVTPRPIAFISSQVSCAVVHLHQLLIVLGCDLIHGLSCRLRRCLCHIQCRCMYSMQILCAPAMATPMPIGRLNDFRPPLSFRLLPSFGYWHRLAASCTALREILDSASS